MTSRIRIVPTWTIAAVAAATIAGCTNAPAPVPVKPPTGVTFGKRNAEGADETREEIDGSQRVIAQFITRMRARDADSVAKLEDKPGSRYWTLIRQNAGSLIRNYAGHLDGQVDVEFDNLGKSNTRGVCLNFHEYPYQLFIWADYGGAMHTDSVHWVVGVDAALPMPSPLKENQTPPSPRRDRDYFCEDGGGPPR